MAVSRLLVLSTALLLAACSTAPRGTASFYASNSSMNLLEAIQVCAEGTDPARHAAAIRTLEFEVLRASGQPHLDRTMLKVLADCHMRFGDYDGAARRYGEILEATDRRREPQGTYYADALAGQARAFYGLQRYGEAAQRFRRALEIKETVLGPEHQEIAGLLTELGRTYFRDGRLPEAEEATTRALAIRESELEPSYLELAINLVDLSTMYQITGRTKEAEAGLERALSVLDAAQVKQDVSLVPVLETIADLYEVQGRQMEAIEVRERISAIEKG